MFIIIWISTFICQIIIIQFGGPWFSTAPLDIMQWAVCLGFGLSELLVGQVRASASVKLFEMSNFFISDCGLNIKKALSKTLGVFTRRCSANAAFIYAQRTNAQIKASHSRRQFAGALDVATVAA